MTGEFRTVPDGGGPITGEAQPDPRAYPPDPGERLDSWKEIAAHLRRSVRTVSRWNGSKTCLYGVIKRAWSSPLSPSWMPGGPAMSRKSKPTSDALSRRVWIAV